MNANTGVMDSGLALRAPRNDADDLKRAPSHSRDTMCPRFANFVHALQEEDAARPSREGAGNAGCPMHPWPHKMRVVFHRFTGLNRHSLRDGFTAYFVLSPATGFVVTVAAW